MAVSPRVEPKTRVKMLQSNKPTEKVNKKLLIIAQEIKLSKILAGNNKTLRDRALRKLPKWFEIREKQMPFREDDFMRVWKGLFYYMWTADKPLVQEECAENIAKLMNFKEVKTSMLFFKCFLQTMINEWFGVDHLRLDKFLMLVRRVLRRCFQELKDDKWNEDTIKKFQDHLGKTILKVDSVIPLGLSMHLTEIYLEELSKVSRGKIVPKILLEFIRPFAIHLAYSVDERLCQHIKTHIFKYLMKQSDVGLEYQERFNAWRQLGFPGGTMDVLEKIELDDKEDKENIDEDEEDDEENGPFDPRAGKVHVELPQLKFDCDDIIKLLEEQRFKPGTTTKSRKALSALIHQFQELKNGNYPLGIKKVPVVESKGPSTKVKSSLKRLQKFEAQLEGTTKKAKTSRERRRKIETLIKNELEKYKDDETTKDNAQTDDIDEFIKKSEGGLMGETPNRTPMKNMVKKRPPTPYPKKVRNPAVDSSTKKSKKTPSESKKFKRSSGVWEVDEISETPKKIAKSTSNWSTEENTPTTVSKKLLKKRKGSYVEDDTEKVTRKKYTPVTMEHSNPLVETPKKSFEKKRPKTHLPASTPQNSLVKNPFSTPQSQKKVKIALNLNKSQDIREHIISVANSPKNPYDGKKVPGKKILKRTSLASVINPFY